MSTPKQSYLVHIENGGTMQVFAESDQEAVEAYYHALEGIIGHQMGICSCFGERKPIDRERVARPTRVERLP